MTQAALLDDYRSLAAGLRALGLAPHAAVVLEQVIRCEEVTAAQVVAATTLSPSQVSVAVAGLKAAGLLCRVENRRPALIMLSPDAGATVDQLAESAARGRDITARQSDNAARTVRDAAARSARRGRPVYEVLPVGDPRRAGFDHHRKGATSHDEVLDDALWLAHWRPSHGCPTRLLVVDPSETAQAALRDRLSRPRRASIEVRTTRDLLPGLLVLDAERVRITAGTAHGRVHAWSGEPAHVQACEQLFGWWWEHATPAFVVEELPQSPFDDTDLEVDEWDGDERNQDIAPRGARDLPDPPHGPTQMFGH